MALDIDNADVVPRQFRTVAFFKVDDTLRDLHQRRGIRCCEILASAETEQQRRTHARHYQTLIIRFVDHRNGVGADQFTQTEAHSFKQIAAGFQMPVHQMSNDFGVGIRDKGVTEAAKLVAHFLVVLDDAVVHHRHATRDVGMGILFGRCAVCRPAGMCNADPAGDVAGLCNTFKLGDAASAAYPLQLVAVGDSDTG